MDARNPNSPADPSHVVMIEDEDLPKWPARTSTSSNASTYPMATVAVPAAHLPAETFDKMSSAESFLAVAVATIVSEVKPKIFGINADQLMYSGIKGLFGDCSTNAVLMSEQAFEVLENTFPLLLHCLLISVKEKGYELEIQPPCTYSWKSVMKKCLNKCHKNVTVPSMNDNATWRKEEIEAEPHSSDDEVDLHSPEPKKLKQGDGPEQPVIPLPELVKLVTGEEDEELIYSHRAKLFRWHDNQWKERGQGEIKILKHGQHVRLLMRREKVLKICLNHRLSADITFLPKGSRAFQWYAPDFSDREMRLEHLAVLFDTEDIATDFLGVALEAKSSLVEQSISVQTASPGQISAVSTVDTSTVLDISDASSAAQIQTPESHFVQHSDPSAVSPGLISAVSTVDTLTVLDACEANSAQFQTPSKSYNFVQDSDPSAASPGLNLSSDDDDVLILEVIEAKVSVEEKAQAQELQLPENFYAYKQRADCKGCRGCDKEEDILEPKSKSPPKAASILGSTTLLDTPLGTPCEKSSVKDTMTLDSGRKQVSDESSGDEEGDEAPDPHFDPIIALPDKINVLTGEEDEVEVFCQRGKLYRYDGENREWNEQGVGDMKLLLHQASGRYRLLLRREPVLKVVLNQRLTTDLNLAPLKNTSNALCWGALTNDQAGEPHAEQLAVKFKNEDILSEFHTKVDEAKERLAAQAPVA